LVATSTGLRGGARVPVAVGATLAARRRRTYTMMLTPALVIMVLMTIVPFLYLLVTSLTP
jgi:hypothetical protein